MTLLRKAKAAAFRARLQLCEAERRRIAETATKSQVNLAMISARLERVEHDIRVLTNELKLLEMPDPEE